MFVEFTNWSDDKPITINVFHVISIQPEDDQDTTPVTDLYLQERGEVTVIGAYTEVVKKLTDAARQARHG